MVVKIIIVHRKMQDLTTHFAVSSASLFPCGDKTFTVNVAFVQESHRKVQVKS